MSNEFVRFGFISGELAPTLYGRSDLEKYDLGLALAYNWYVDYRGGITTRPGTEFGDYMPLETSKFVRFEFAPDVANTYILVFGNQTIRFIQDNAYVLEATKPIVGVTQASQGVVNITAHGFLDGDWVYLFMTNGMTELNRKLVVVSNKTADTFKIKDYFGNYISTSGFSAYVNGGTARRVYTVTSPYAGDDVRDIRSTQLRDTLRLTHSAYPVNNLKRISHRNWQLTPEVIACPVARPTGAVATYPPVGSPPGASCAYVVTAVDYDENESEQSDHAFVVEAKDMTRTAATYRVDWDTQSNVWYYNVYRTIIRIFTNDYIGRTAELGYVGRAYGTTFYDNNTIPDFGRTPPRKKNPFANGSVRYINVLTSTSDFDNATVIGITSATGAGFVGYPIIQQSTSGSSTGPLVAILVIDGGHDYKDTDTVTATVGTTATFELKLTPASGNNPRVSAIFQQRQLYAATDNKPLTAFGSKPGKFSNFDAAAIVLDDDAYEHEIDASVVSPIKHILPLRGGLLVMSGEGVWVLSGENGAALTPKNPVADPQSFTGVADVRPIQIGTDVLYIENHGFTARLLNYKDINKVYTGEDISLLSSHFFNLHQQIENFAYAAAPHKLVWAQRSDGSLLAFTVLREQNMYAWTQHWTRGAFRDTIQVNETTLDSVYFAVERTINGNKVKFFERLKVQDFEFVEDAWCLDCALALPKNYPAATVSLARASGPSVRATASANVFSPSDVGKILRASGAKGTVITYFGPRNVDINVVRPANKFVPFTRTPMDALEGEWTLDPTYTSVSGLDYAEGETLMWLGDGNVGSGTVVGGQLTNLPNVSRFVAGFAYVCDMKTLPISDQQQPIEARKKRTLAVAVNRMQARGLKVGSTFNKMYDMKDRMNEIAGEPIEVQDGIKYELITPDAWKPDAAVCIRQDQPLPATIRALVLDAEIGDAPH